MIFDLLTIYITIFSALIWTVNGSVGDRSSHFNSCAKKCEITHCVDNYAFIDATKNTLVNQLLQWGCADECDYNCMWQTVDYFHAQGLRTPQFHGKWPFIRILGIQEPASTFFSLLNLYVHWRCFKNFRKSVRVDNPLYYNCQIFYWVNMNAWIWSTIFHTRDTLWTEFLDYSFAFSVVLITAHCMFKRITYNKISQFKSALLSLLFIGFYVKHISYLNGDRFDYAYNMSVNVAVAGLTIFISCAWALYNRFRMPHVWKAACFFAMVSLVSTFELIDKPPLFYVLDFHAIWHGSTAIIIVMFYSFMIDDCVFLRKQSLN